jgi:S-adenosylmethionine-dependent methyltransferase
MSKVERYYDDNAEREWKRLEEHRTEFAVTMRTLEEYLPKPPADLLDVGGGPGRYAILLSERGYRVTLADISGAMLAFARSKAAEAGVELAGCLRADAAGLGVIPSERFDAVLLMGPLYHLITPRERQAAVSEAYRLLREGGVLFAAFITRYAPIRYVAKYDPQFIVEHPDKLEEMLTTGVNIGGSGGGFTNAYFALPTEIRPLMQELGFNTLDLIACEGVVSRIDERINELTGEEWEEWVDLNYLLGKDPTIHGAADHLLYVGMK